MTFPFKITQDIIDAYQQHDSYTSAGQAWLLRNDPEGQNEEVLLEQIITKIQDAAQDHFGDDEDAYEEFCDDVGLEDISGGDWYDTVGAELETTKMNTPYWHDEKFLGPWTPDLQQDLIEELTYALTHRSLTPEEKVWLKEAAE